MLKRILILALGIAVGLYFVSVVLAQTKVKIGIMPSSDSPQYTETLKGLLKELKKEGFDESKATIEIRNAENKKEMVAEIAKDFRAKKMDVIIPIGTVAAVGTYDEIKDIPIVFCLIFDPIGAKIANSWESSGTNTTGSSNWVEMKALIKVLREVSPGKRIGVIYNETEQQTVIQLEAFQKIQDKEGITVVPANLTKAEDAKNVTNGLVGRVDGIYIPGGTVAAQGLDGIMEVAKKAKIPTISHLLERVEKGALLAVSANSSQVGELAGKKAAQVLRGTKPADIPIEYLQKYDIAVNLKTAKEMGIRVPVSLLKTAKKVIE
jgi:putative ABC transport system substrate-binding protein